MLTIRLSRTGKRNKPQYRIVVQDKQRDPWSPAIDVVGTYNPHTEPSTITLKEERVKEWLAKGAEPSATVHNMLVDAGLIKGEKMGTVSITKKRAAKMAEKKAQEEEAKQAAIEAKKAEEEAKKAEAEAAKAAQAEADVAKEAEAKAEPAAEATPEPAPAASEEAAQ